MTRRRFQLAVVGSGFAGSILAMAARRLGLSVVLLERGRHPRFAIGESSTPLANLLLEEIADEFDLRSLRSFSKWGTWQRDHPEITCGIKRGFTFYHHEFGRPFPTGRSAALSRQLMVGASPGESVADTHWFREEFDLNLVREAQQIGVEYLDEAVAEAVTLGPDSIRVCGTRRGRPFSVATEFLVDASGPRGFLHRALHLSQKRVAGFPRTQGLYTHFKGVAPLGAHFAPGEPPYPPEHAAVHHVFDGGWIWVLKFNNGITSAGAAVTEPLARRLGLRLGEQGWRNLLRELPSVARAFESAHAVRPFTWQPRIAFQSAVVAGRRWALLPAAAGAIDPLLSTGFPLNLLGIQRLARLLRQLRKPGFLRGLAEYAGQTTKEFEAAARLVGALYSRMGRFSDFKNLSLLYFAAASYSEAMRRLGKSALAPDFLLCENPEFGPRLRELCESSARGQTLARRVRAANKPFDVAGLTDSRHDPWYPALPISASRREF